MTAKRARARGRRAGASILDRERIADAAVALLDMHGPDGLTMRKLAEHLDSGVMSLYWHVDNKDAVLDLALDRVLEFADASTDGPWREAVVRYLEDWRATMVRHPWAAALLPRRALGENMLDRLERISERLASGGVLGTDLNHAVWALWNYVMGATITLTNFGISDADRVMAQDRIEALQARYPTIHRSSLLLDDDWDEVFRNGLLLLLDGLTARR